MDGQQSDDEYDIEERRCLPVMQWAKPVDVPVLG